MRAFSHALVTCGHVTDGSHTVRSAVSENPLLHANFVALCFIEPELCFLVVGRAVRPSVRPLTPTSHDAISPYLYLVVVVVVVVVERTD